MIKKKEEPIIQLFDIIKDGKYYATISRHTKWTDKEFVEYQQKLYPKLSRLTY